MATDSDKESVTCQMCAQLYTDPSMLPCLHSFCKECLPAASKQEIITCPLCEEISCTTSFLPNQYLARRVEEYKELISPMPCEGCATSVSANVFCHECSKYLCNVCYDQHKSSSETKEHAFIDAKEKKQSVIARRPLQPLQCPIPEHGLLNYFCHDCRLLTCSDCILVNHKTHKYSKISSSLREACHSNICNGTQQCQKAATTIDDAITCGNDLIQQIRARKNQVDQEIESIFDELLKALSDRKKSLLKKSNEVAIGKETAVHIQLEDFRKLKQQLLSATEFATEMLQSHQSSAELLSTKKNIEDRLSKLNNQFEELSCDIAEDSIIIASLDAAALLDFVSQFGDISNLSPSLSAIESGVAIPLATVNKQRKFQVSLKKSTGCPVEGRVPAVPIVASLVNVKCRDRKKVEVVVSKEDQCTLTCTPDTVGECELSVKVRGAHVSNSPYRMWARKERDLRFLRTRRKAYNVDSNAFGVAVQSNGDVFVTADKGYVQVFSNSGIQKMKIGSKGSENGQFDAPRGIALVQGHKIYVVEKKNHRVQWFTTTDGKYIGKIGGTSGSDKYQLSYPNGIAYDGKDYIMVADTGNKRIQVFTLDGTFVNTIDCEDEIYDVAVDNNGHIHVPLYTKHKVQVFSSDGVKLYDYSNNTTEFEHPEGIAIDENGYRYVTTHNNQLHILDSTGSQINVVEDFRYPYGVALDTEGYIYVADRREHKVFQY